VYFAFYQLFVFHIGYRKQRKFGKLRVTLPVNMALFSKEDKMWSKVCLNVKVTALGSL